MDPVEHISAILDYDIKCPGKTSTKENLLQVLNEAIKKDLINSFPEILSLSGIEVIS